MQAIQRIYAFFLDRGNLSMVLFIFIALGISWATIDQIDYNYGLEQEQRQSEEQVALLQQRKANQELQNQFFQTEYYKELAVRDELGLVSEGERVAVLDRDAIEEIVQKYQPQDVAQEADVATNQASPLEQWARFFSGQNPL